MNEAQVAGELYGSYEEKVLLFIGNQGGHVERDQLEQFTGDPWAASHAIQR